MSLYPYARPPRPPPFFRYPSRGRGWERHQDHRPPPQRGRNHPARPPRLIASPAVPRGQPASWPAAGMGPAMRHRTDTETAKTIAAQSIQLNRELKSIKNRSKIAAFCPLQRGKTGVANRARAAEKNQSSRVFCPRGRPFCQPCRAITSGGQRKKPRPQETPREGDHSGLWALASRALASGLSLRLSYHGVPSPVKGVVWNTRPV